MNADLKRSAAFWQGNNEVPSALIKQLYGKGPYRGGLSRSEIAHRLNIDISIVNQVIGKRRLTYHA